MKLFIAKLNREANEENLTEQFSQFGGVVSVKVVTDRDTGQSKCFGFIEMDSAESGTTAINEQNGEEFLGFRMVVKEAEDKPRAPRPPSSGGDRGTRGDTSNRGSRDERGAGDKQSGSSNDTSSGKTFTKSPASSSKSSNKKPSKRGKGSSDKFADGPKKTTFEKRPKSNPNQWLDDLDDF